VVLCGKKNLTTELHKAENCATAQTTYNTLPPQKRQFMTTYMKDSKAPPRTRGNPLEDQKVRRSEDQNEEGRELGSGSWQLAVVNLCAARSKKPIANSQQTVRTCGGSKPAVTWVKPPGAPGGNTLVTVPPTTGFPGGRLLLFRTSVATLCPLWLKKKLKHREH
jgi:hypothetical protein